LDHHYHRLQKRRASQFSDQCLKNEYKIGRSRMIMHLREAFMSGRCLLSHQKNMWLNHSAKLVQTIAGGSRSGQGEMIRIRKVQKSEGGHRLGRITTRKNPRKRKGKATAVKVEKEDIRKAKSDEENDLIVRLIQMKSLKGLCTMIVYGSKNQPSPPL
jgi:hypothetical protein